MIARIATAASFAFILAMIVSCSSTIPPALLVCKEGTVYAGRKNVSATDLLEFTDQVAVAGADCRARLKAVKNIVDGQN
ncbi:hypothetical protein GFL58_30680 [Rhizobium leguminosarum bv. viciae]|uniref:hypothetical protein n=1 Tax=Rhizobium leguminosarum TaxID=384 RepID=UPI00143F4AA4|nr:hypothetical protein [Rhizobium leguminosarum]NKM65285.1 hypothetical protein [Rhizobium leguminosarum bv. viciae]